MSELTDKGVEVAKVPIQGSQDVVLVRFMSRQQAERIGFDAREVISFSTCVSELARNVVQHAKAPGEVIIFDIKKDGKKGCRVVVSDHGEGITNPNQILAESDKMSSGGLYGTNRFADSLEIKSQIGRGTTVVFEKLI